MNFAKIMKSEMFIQNISFRELREACGYFIYRLKELSKGYKEPDSYTKKNVLKGLNKYYYEVISDIEIIEGKSYCMVFIEDKNTIVEIVETT